MTRLFHAASIGEVSTIASGAQEAEATKGKLSRLFPDAMSGRTSVGTYDGPLLISHLVASNGAIVHGGAASEFLNRSDLFDCDTSLVPGTRKDNE